MNLIVGKTRVWIRWLGLIVAGGCLFGGGCAGIVQRELEVLFRPEANPLLIQDSFLVNVFGPDLLKLFM